MYSIEEDTTPLIEAAGNGDDDIVRLLLEAGADKPFKLLKALQHENIRLIIIVNGLL